MERFNKTDDMYKIIRLFTDKNISLEVLPKMFAGELNCDLLSKNPDFAGTALTLALVDNVVLPDTFYPKENMEIFTRFTKGDKSPELVSKVDSILKPYKKK